MEISSISTLDRFTALARAHASFGAAFASLAGLSAADSPAAPSFASGTLALVAGVVCVALLLLAVAASLDAAAAPLFRDALAASRQRLLDQHSIQPEGRDWLDILARTSTSAVVPAAAILQPA
jgi:hypothetical protein